MGDAQEAQITDLPAGIQPLVTTLMLHSARDNAHLATQLMDGYKRERDQARAELSLIREHIREMYAGPWMPNPDRVLDALWPDEILVNLRMECGE